MLCGSSIERFLQYDYVGAPWPPNDRMVRGKAWLQDVGGNGGLSLRRRSQAANRWNRTLLASVLAARACILSLHTLLAATL